MKRAKRAVAEEQGQAIPDAGRPTKFRKEFVKQVERLTKLGATDVEIADFFGVNVLTIYRWKHDYPSFCKAMGRGKELADQMVEDRLFARAVGFAQPATKIMQHDGVPITVYYTERFPPDVSAGIFWLKNRRSGAWRDRVEHTGANGEAIQFNMINRPAKEE